MRGARVTAQPILVGAVTILITIVAVFLAYNANQGLPFVPVTELEVELPNGAALVPGNEVRIGGQRIGMVTDLQPAPLTNGDVGTIARVSLDQKHGDIPVDSKITVRPRSPLGLKFIAVDRGDADETFRQGDRIPVAQARLPVEIDEFWGMYDAETRDGVRANLEGFGTGLAGRGIAINRAIEDAPRFLRHLEPVARTLGAPETQLRRMFRSLGRTARAVGPVAERYAHAFTAGADVFEAWARDPEALRATIRESAPTLDAGIRSLRRQRPFLTRLASTSREIRGAAETMPATLPALSRALDVANPVLRRVPAFNEDLERVLASLERLMLDPGTGRALRALGSTSGTLNPALRFLGPHLTVCNGWNYAWTHVAEHLTEPDPTGGSQRTLLNQAGRQNNPVTSLGATEPANGEGHISGTPQHLHAQAYAAAVTEDGRADCEAGQRGYPERIAALWPDRFNIVIDPRTPGVQGPPRVGRPRVPRGQTFSKRPELGPRLHPELDR